MGNLLTILGPVRFSGKTLLHVVNQLAYILTAQYDKLTFIRKRLMSTRKEDMKL